MSVKYYTSDCLLNNWYEERAYIKKLNKSLSQVEKSPLRLRQEMVTFYLFQCSKFKILQTE